MKIKTRKREGIAIVDLEGNIDINASDFIETVGVILRNNSRHILCNFGGINLIDYIGVSILAIIYKNVINHKAEIKLYNVPAHVQKIFTIVGLSKVLECYENEDQAINSFKEDKVISQILQKKLRRRFRRIAFKSTIEYKQKFSKKLHFFRGKVLNLSGTGAFVIAEKVFAVGEILTVRLHLLPEPGVITIEAKVAWISYQSPHPLEYPAMGIEFHHISTKKQRAIIEFVDKHLASDHF